MVRHYSVLKLVAMTIEGAYIVVGLERVGCDNHDLAIEMVQVLD
jgi:hypothetical protein